LFVDFGRNWIIGFHDNIYLQLIVAVLDRNGYHFNITLAYL